MKKSSLWKRILSVLLVVLMAGSTLAACGGAGGTAKKTEIYMLIASPEFKEPTQKLCDEYMKENPNISIIYEASSDYGTEFQAKVQANEIPDIFFAPSGYEMRNYEELCYDLSDQPLADALAPDVRTGLSWGDKLCGFAQATDVFGLIYNMDVLKECGITELPETQSDFIALCETVDAAGYQVMTTGAGDGWPLKHVLQPFINATGENVDEMRDSIAAGKSSFADYPKLYKDFFDFVDLEIKYGGRPLESTFDGQIADMVSGNVAIMAGQGSWAEGEILRAKEDFNLGFAGYPVSEDPADCTIELGTSQAICVYKDSKNLEEALAFANWWNTSDYGKNWYADEIITYPPLSDAKFPTSALNTATTKIIEEKGRSGAMSIYAFPSHLIDDLFTQTMQRYVEGTISRDEACAEIDAAFAETVEVE